MKVNVTEVLVTIRMSRWHSGRKVGDTVQVEMTPTVALELRDKLSHLGG